MLRIAPFRNLLTHFRYLLTLRSQEGTYRSLILFRLAPNINNLPIGNNGDAESQQLYIMEANCPHLGADMSHADIEEVPDSMAPELGIVAVCPWHRYDFDLKTGKSETGLNACTYGVQIRTDDAGQPDVFMETPCDGTAWRLVELRPVSEEFADPPPAVSPLNPVTVHAGTQSDEPIVPEKDPPKTLMEWAVLILNTPNPTLKVNRTRHAVHLFRTGKLTSIGNRSASAPSPPKIPPRESSFLLNTVSPTQIRSRKNRAGILHALANIEQWAIDLAWDIMARFGPRDKDLPHAFFSDFTKMAEDESKHFSLLVSRLSTLSPQTPYGSLPVHASLWDSARLTSHSLRSRLAIIHLVHEARGLDVNPGTIERFRKAGDTDSVKVMEIIHADEVTHVTAGHRWFTWVCQKQSEGEGPVVDPVVAFRDEVRALWTGEIKGPFNAQDREKAGLSREFYEGLKGELPPFQMLEKIKESEGPTEANVGIEYEK